MPTSRFGRRGGMNPGKRRIHSAVYLADLSHMQPRRVDAIDTTGGEQIALFDIGTGGHELQFKRAPLHGRVTHCHVAAASAGIHDRNALVTVCQQGHLADQGVHPRDLTDNTRSIDDC